MVVIFTDLYVNECERKLKINRNEVMQAYVNPDKQQKLVSQGLLLRLYTKRLEKYHLLLQCHEQDSGNFFVDLAFKVKDDIVGDDGEPLQILEELISRFGLTVRVGNQQKKFIYNEMVPVSQSARPQTIIQVINPANHSFIQSAWFRLVDQPGQRFAQCALVFCLDSTTYSTYV